MTGFPPPDSTESSATGSELAETLRDAQRLGMLGPRSIDEVIRHAGGFVAALTDVRGVVVDLGSGGGVPGLVIARQRPDLRVVLTDRRQKRTDFLSRAVTRLGFGDRVSVRCVDVRELARHEEGSFDAVTARGFGPPLVTLELGLRLVAGRGPIVISEPPTDDRWDPDILSTLGVRRHRSGPVSVFRRG